MNTIRIPRYILTFSFVFALIGFLNLPGIGLGGGKGKELGEDAPIRFDGFYYKRGIMNPGQQQRSGYTYFRFYPDRTVLMLASASEPEKVSRRFGYGYNHGESKFKLYEETGAPGIKFSIKHFGVAQSYEGKAGKDSLQLHLYGGQSEYEYDDSYLFYKVENPPK
jgi:hypothetical protein